MCLLLGRWLYPSRCGQVLMLKLWTELGRTEVCRHTAKELQNKRRKIGMPLVPTMKTYPLSDVVGLVQRACNGRRRGVKQVAHR